MNRGMTLLEVMIALAVVSVVIGATLMAVIPMTQSEGYLAADTRLHSDARRALQSLADDLRQAGNNTDIGGLIYPHIWAPYDPAGGPDDADSGFEAYNALPPGTNAAVHAAVAGDPDFGATTHVVFQIPEDSLADANTIATDETTGEIEWSGDIVYCLVQNPVTGLNELRRYTDYAAGTFTTLATNVERLFIERHRATADSDDGAVWDDDDLNVSEAEIRLTIQLRVPNPASVSGPVRGTVSTSVSMRN